MSDQQHTTCLSGGSQVLVPVSPGPRPAVQPGPNAPGTIREELAAVASYLGMDPEFRAVDRSAAWEVAQRREIPHRRSAT